MMAASAAAERLSREEKRLAADMAEAQARSLALARRESFDKFSPSSEGLWAWGKDCRGWTLAHEHMHDREKVLDALVAVGAPLIGNKKKQFIDNWRHHLDVEDPDAQPPPDEALEQGDEDDEEDESAGDGGQPASSANAAAEFAAAKREQVARDKQERAAAAAAAPAAAARSPAPPVVVDRRPMPMRACRHCLFEAPHATPAFKCTNSACLMRSDLDWDAPQNVYFRGGGSVASGQSDTDTPAARAPKDALSRRDKEFERLADEGAPFPRFEETAAISSADALEGVRESMWATNYADPTVSLLKLIRSGKAVKMGFLLPRLASQTQTRADFADTGILFVNGRSEATGSVVAPTLQSWDDFTHALLSVVIPALFDRPRALLDWVTLARTVQELNREHGWPTANRYLDAVLADKVTRRAPFGAYDSRIYDAVTKPHGGGAARSAFAGTPQRGAGAPSFGGAAAYSSPAPRPPAAAPDAHAHACRDWNFGRCNRPACAMAHECMWIACRAADRAHPGNACAHRPPPMSRGGGSASSVASARSGGRSAPGGGARSRA